MGTSNHWITDRHDERSHKRTASSAFSAAFPAAIAALSTAVRSDLERYRQLAGADRVVESWPSVSVPDRNADVAIEANEAMRTLVLQFSVVGQVSEKSFTADLSAAGIVWSDDRKEVCTAEKISRAALEPILFPDLVKP